MTKEMLLFGVLIIYISTTLGIAIKFYLKGIRSKLLFSAPMIPFFICFFNLKLIINKLIKNNKIKKYKILIYVFKAILFDIIMDFPILVGIIAKVLFELQKDMEKNIKSQNQPKSINIDGIFTSYSDFYSEGVNEKLIVQ